MPFEEGNPGRPPGSRNKRTAQWDALVASLEGEQADNFTKYMKSLWTGDDDQKAQAAELYLKLLEFHKPKLARSEHTGADGDDLTVTHKWGQ